MSQQAIEKRRPEVTLETVQHMTGYELPQIALVRTKMAVALGTDSDKVPLRDVLLYIQAAQELGLSPLLNQIHWISRGGKASHQVGIDGLRAIADRSGAYAGSDPPVFRGELDIGDKDKPLRVPEMASVLVRKIVQGRVCSFTGEAYWREFYPSEANQGFMYRKMPRLMLAKDAEAQALRKAFPAQLGGVPYSSVDVAEMAQEADEEVNREAHHRAEYQRILGEQAYQLNPGQKAEVAGAEEDFKNPGESEPAAATPSPQESQVEVPVTSAWERHRTLAEQATQLRIRVKTLRADTPLDEVEAYNQRLETLIESETERRRGIARQNLAS